MAVEGTDLPLWGMEVDVERARAEIKVRILHLCGAASRKSSAFRKLSDCPF